MTELPHNASIKGIADSIADDDGTVPNRNALGDLGGSVHWNNLHSVPESILNLGRVPPGTVVTNLNSDKLDGHHAGTSADECLVLDVSGKVPLSNIPSGPGMQLNADLLDGHHAGTSADECLILDSNGKVPAANIPSGLSAAAHASTHNPGGGDALSGSLDVSISGNAGSATFAYYAP